MAQTSKIDLSEVKLFHFKADLPESERIAADRGCRLPTCLELALITRDSARSKDIEGKSAWTKEEGKADKVFCFDEHKLIVTSEPDPAYLTDMVVLVRG